MKIDTLENAIASSDDGKILKSPWHESEPNRPSKSVEEAWKEQCALISALSDEPPPEESSEEGKRAAKLENKELIQKVDEMESDGYLGKVLDYLAASHDATSKQPVDPKVIVRVAQLLCIMDESVYMRDFEAEKRVQDKMKMFKRDINSALDNSKRLSESTVEAIEGVFKEMDRVTKKINEVAARMGLKYVPLCNFSSYGRLFCNGPYCGAFYREPQNADNGFIVVAFKGTGTFGEWLTDLTFNLSPAKDNSPLRGNCHSGFFKGIFSEFPSELSADAKVGKAIPFQLLKNQLWRLAGQMTRNKADRRVPVWITGHSLGGAYATHCWQGLPATSRVNPHDKNRTIRDLFTFGSPRVGDQDYARYPNDIKTFQRSWRFVNENDIVTKLPLGRYCHLDRKVKISPQKILLRENKLDSPEGFITKPMGHLLGVTAHGLGSYWESLRKAKNVEPRNWQEEGQIDKIPPTHDSLATWSLEDHHPQEYVHSKSHRDHWLQDPESVGEHDRREAADRDDYIDGGKYRSVVKIQSMFPARDGSDPVWTMGTGWLIREDLVVTAGHNVFSNTYGGQAERIKCWIGYRGRDSANKPYVQHRNALNIVTTQSWYKRIADRRRDVALIQVSAPFDGNLKLFRFRNTATKLNNEPLTIVGYPGDKHIKDKYDDDDYGAEMYFGKKTTSFDLEKTNGMIEYRIDTYGGAEEGLVGIGTHCYGAGGDNPLNSGNAIGGRYGNHYEEFRKCLDGTNPKHPTPIGTFEPKFKVVGNGAVPGEDNGDVSGEGEESFWDIFKTIAKVALPAAGGILGPVGGLFGTVAGGIIGSLAEGARDPAAVTTPKADVQERFGQSVLRNEENLEWSHFKQNPELVDVISPVLTEYGLLMAVDHWEKKIDPNPEARRLLDDKVSLQPSESINPVHPKAAFVNAIYKDETRRVEGIPENGEESLSEWLTPLIRQAIIVAKPVATKTAKSILDILIGRMKKGPAESLPTRDEQNKSFQTIIHRAIMADCALQAIETLNEKELQELTLSPANAGNEEGIIDSIKTRVQKIGPVALKYAKITIRKHLPVLLGELGKKLNANIATTTLMSLPAFNFPRDGPIPRLSEEDDNPDAPPVEPCPPASPTTE